jgi:hypothetical protein
MTSVWYPISSNHNRRANAPPFLSLFTLLTRGRAPVGAF